jgi:hypothetical protein
LLRSNGLVCVVSGILSCYHAPGEQTETHHHGERRTDGRDPPERRESASRAAQSGDRCSPPRTLVGPPDGGLLATPDAKLREDLGDVILHSVAGDAQSVGDLGVREAVAQELEDLPRGRPLRFMVRI